MQRDNKKSGRTKKVTQKNKRPSEPDLTRNSASDNDVIKAHSQADKDIDDDPELSAHSSKDDLDEEEALKRDNSENPLV